MLDMVHIYPGERRNGRRAKGGGQNRASRYLKIPELYLPGNARSNIQQTRLRWAIPNFSFIVDDAF
jgi:hypothetical protein